MIRFIRRCLLTVALAVTAPLPVLHLAEATAQDGPRPDQPKAIDDPNSNNPFGIRNSRLPADHDREVRTTKLLSEYKRATDEKDRAKVLDDLTKVVSEQFETRQTNRERELKELEDHVRKLRELHQRRAKEKDQIVRDRVRQLLRDAEGLGWGDDGRPRPSRTDFYPASSPKRSEVISTTGNQR